MNWIRRSTLLTLIVIALALYAFAGPFSGIPVVGSFTGDGRTGTFTGTVDVVFFSAQGDNVTAFLNLSGTLTDNLGATESITATRLGPLPATILSSTCQLLEIEVAPILVFSNSLGIQGQVHSPSSLNIVVPDITDTGGANRFADRALCNIARLHANGGRATSTANQLNRLIKLVE